MIKVSLFNPIKWQINEDTLERLIGEVLLEHSVDKATVTVAFVSDKEISKLSKKYYKDDGEIHSVLSFPAHETDKKFIYPPDENFLGEIVIAPDLVEGGVEEVLDLVKHSCLHLVGLHHS